MKTRRKRREKGEDNKDVRPRPDVTSKGDSVGVRSMDVKAQANLTAHCIPRRCGLM